MSETIKFSINDHSFTHDRYRLSSPQLDMTTQFSLASKELNGLVVVSPELFNLPVVIDKNGDPIPVFHVIEVIEEAVDLDYVLEELPTLGADRIIAVLHFARRLSMFNSKGIDFDRCRLERDAVDQDLIEALRSAIEDRENVVNVYSKPD